MTGLIVKFNDLKSEAVHYCEILGLKPDSYLDAGDERINKQAWEYLLHLAAKLASIRAKDENRAKIGLSEKVKKSL